MHNWLGWSVRAVLSGTPPYSAGKRETEVGSNGPAEKGGEWNRIVACICCRTYEPAHMAVGISGDSAAGTVPVKAVLGAAYVFVVESPLAHGGLFLRRHELWRAHGSASAVGQCDAKQPISYKLLMSIIGSSVKKQMPIPIT